MGSTQKTVLILVNKETTILQFRLEVVEALVKAGYRVIVSTPLGTRYPAIEAVGATVVGSPLEKDGTNPIQDVALLRYYRRLMRELRPDVVLTYTIKPNVYGGMAAAAYKIPYVANITGLGAVLGREGLMQKLALILYRLGFRKISKVFFQNEENRAFFETHKLAVGKHEMIPGSGVNLERFAAMEYPPDDTVHFAYISRIRKEKGIEQYVEAARAVRAKHPNAQFHVCGYGDEASEAWIRGLDAEGVVVYHGFLPDVRAAMGQFHCIVHPTYYPEGMSNVLLESAASGRALITTDRAGCREAVEHGVNGYLIREKDSADLIEKIEQFLALSYQEKREMGSRGREKMVREFNRAVVVERYLETVAELTNHP